MKTLKIPDKPMILSVSGGVDSMVLLSLATHPESVVVHFNHGLRESATRDALFVQQQALAKNFRFELIHLSISSTQNIQDTARRLRYQHLIEISKKYEIKDVLLGHHGDDLVESMLLHLLRGTSIKGLQMRQTFTLDDVVFSRPLLSHAKAAIINYANEHKIAYVSDESNESDAYLRNRIRHHVIPLLIKEQPKLIEKFSQLSNHVQELIPFLDTLTDEAFEAKTRQSYLELAPVLQKHLLRRWLDHHHISAHNALLNQMDEILRSEVPHQEVTLSEESRMQTSYQTIRFVTNVTTLDFMQKINAPGTFTGPNHDIVIVTTDPTQYVDTMATIQLDSLDVFPLELRHRKPGDVVHLTGGRKKLKDWLIDLKIDRQERDHLLVLAKDSTVLWIPALNYQTSQSGEFQLYCSWRPHQ